ncbi:glycoside hydrolase family 97 protein [soil metagenome]
MTVKKIALCLFCISLSISKAMSQMQTGHVTMNRVTLAFEVTDDGIPQYAVSFAGKPVIESSRLGFKLQNGMQLDSNFHLVQKDTLSVDETWKPVWGEEKQVRNHYKQITFHLQQMRPPNYDLDIVFRVYDDGVGFRYEIPVQFNLNNFIVSEELTQFNLTGDHKAFWIPGDFDSNEYPYTTSKLSEVDAWKLPMLSFGNRQQNIPDQYAVQTPLMLKTEKGMYINIHEAALVDYPSMQLHVNRATFSLSSNLVPDAVGNKAYLRTPAYTPWRTIIVSDKATDILSSRMIINLNEPSKIENTSWIQPMKFIGVWWEMQVGKSSWSYSDHLDSLFTMGTMKPNGRHGANTANVKRYIDFASANGIKGLLVEGWNTGWEEWSGNWTGHHFDFGTPYPDFDVKEIESYSKMKGVQMIMHNETSADAATYERQMDTAFQFMNDFGYNSVKTGYVGQIIPRGEHHDGQWMVNHYVQAAKKAAQYHVMIDMHEPVRPTGLHRTWPNFIASEAGRGNEWNAFSNGNLPEHETIMPFTRLMGGPMDYTPGIFKLRNYASGAPMRQVHTTLAKQLALYITMYSPLQMAADIPENYEAHMDAFQFIKDVAVDWDDTKIVEAEPGDYITIARKEKGKNNWFIGAITDENSRVAAIPLRFLDKGEKYIATVYHDAANANWETNPEAYKIDKYKVDDATTLNLILAKGGGAAISIVPATAENMKYVPSYQ